MVANVPCPRAMAICPSETLIGLLPISLPVTEEE